MSHNHAFIPAAGHDRFLALYDPLTRLLGARAALRQLCDQAAVIPGQRVLDIGCGTGTLAIMLKRRAPDVRIVGLDPDPNALQRAQRKAREAGVEIDWVQAFADAIPDIDATFDCVLSSLMLHHLDRGAKRAALCDVRRVLKPGGSLHIVDFAARGDRPRGIVARLLHGEESLQDNATSSIVAMLREAGFALAERVDSRRTLFGPIDYHRAVK